MANHRDALRKWLREKNYHKNDIASALEFYDQNTKGGKKLSDLSVLNMAEKFHKTAVEKAVVKVAEGNPVLVRYESRENYILLMFVAMFGIFSGIGFYEFKMEIYKWGLEMMQSLLLLMG